MDAVSHSIDNHGDRRLWDCFEGYEAVEGAERDCDDLCVLCCTSHEDGSEEVIRLWSIYRVNNDTSGNVWDGCLRRVPDARFAVAWSGDALRIANDFSAALR